MKSYWGWANFLSVANLLCGVCSILSSFSLESGKGGYFILAAVVFDFLDGKVARSLHEESFFGKGLDSLSDMVSFGIAPAVLAYTMINGLPIWAWGVLVVFPVAGAWRLAYFIQWGKNRRPPGMPITVNGLIFPGLLILHLTGWMVVGAAVLSMILMAGPILMSRQPVQ